MIRAKEPAKKAEVRKARTAVPTTDEIVTGALAKAGIPAASKQGEKINTGSDDPLMSPVLIAFTQGQKRWLDGQASARKCRRSEVVRSVIAEAMVR